MAVIGQSHLLWRNRIPDHSYHSNTIVRIVPTEVVFKLISDEATEGRLFHTHIVFLGEMISLGMLGQTMSL